MKVHISSYTDNEARAVGARLRDLYAVSDRTHTLVEDAERADIILIGGLGNEKGEGEYLREVVNNELIGRYPWKCFTLSYRDAPIVFNRGIYESPVRTLLGSGRVRTGSYAVSGSCNCYVKAYRTGHNGGVPKQYLCSFIGRDSNVVRRRLFGLRFKRKDVFIEDSSEFLFWDCNNAAEKERRERRYFEVLMQSKFALCPRGVGTGSIRLFEAMKCGVAPVIISDDWVWPAGVPWKDCAVSVSEKNVSSIEDVLRAHEDRYAAMGRLAQSAYEGCFAERSYFNYVVANCVEMMQGQRVSEAVYWRLRWVVAGMIRLRRSAGRVLRRIRKR
jgi:hypothetical protein